jgi:hypothetical protein
VLPAGTLRDPSLIDDAATPVHRAAVLLVPALLLLVIGPVGTTLTRGLVPLRAVLAATDALVCIYAAIAVPAEIGVRGVTAGILVALMGVLALLSVADAVQILRVRRTAGRGSTSLRLALSLLVLLTPSWFLVQSDRELASLLAPFGYVALSAAAESAARSERALRRTAALLQTVVAAHFLIALRYTIEEETPAIREVGAFGRTTLVLAGVVLGLAVLRLLALRRRGSSPAPRATVAAAS